jgi:hypothetical protein
MSVFVGAKVEGPDSIQHNICSDRGGLYIGCCVSDGGTQVNGNTFSACNSATEAGQQVNQRMGNSGEIKGREHNRTAEIGVDRGAQ